MHPKDAEGMANSVNPDQTAPSAAVWSWSTLFSQTCLSEYLGSALLYVWPKTFYICIYLILFSWKVHGQKIMWATSWQNQQNECVPSEDSDQPGHPPSLIRVFAVHSMGSWGPKVSSCGQRRLWSDWVDAQADLSLRWTHSHFVGFVMSRLMLKVCEQMLS